MDQEAPRRPIKPPKKAPKNQAVRRIAKAAAGSVPYAGAVLTEIADVVVSDHEAADRDRWASDVTDGMNHLHGRVDNLDDTIGIKKVSFEGASYHIAKYMIESCPDGLGHQFVSLDEIQALHPELSKHELENGFGDLESYGMIDSRKAINASPRYFLTQSGYEHLDKPVMGWRTEDDARAIAAIVVRKRDSIRASELEEELGWSRRRLNPALRIVVDFIHPGRVSQTIQPDYVTRYFMPDNAELAILRRFAAGD